MDVVDRLPAAARRCSSPASSAAASATAAPQLVTCAAAAGLRGAVVRSSSSTSAGVTAAPRTTPIFTWIDSGELPGRTGRCARSADGGDAGRGHHRLGHGPYLFHRLHGTTTSRSRASSRYLSLFTFCMLMLVTADNFVQLFFGWEGRGPLLLPADRLLVRASPRPTPRRSRPSSSTASAISASRSASWASISSSSTVRIRRGLRRGRRPWPAPPSSSSACTCRPWMTALPPALHRRHGQVGAVRPAHLAAGRDGRARPRSPP